MKLSQAMVIAVVGLSLIANFGDEIGSERGLRTRPEERQFQVIRANAMQNWYVVALWKALWTQKPDSNLSFANRPVSVGV